MLAILAEHTANWNQKHIESAIGWSHRFAWSHNCTIELTDPRIKSTGGEVWGKKLSDWNAIGTGHHGQSYQQPWKNEKWKERN